MDKKLKSQIMGRIYAIYLVRRYGKSLALSIFAFFTLFESVHSISFRNVFANMPELSDINASYNFFSSAIQNTEIAIQLSLGVITLGLLFYATSLLRKLPVERGFIRIS